MRSSHAAAVWMFERLGSDVALAGDLLEECAQGRSTIWYWRQVLIAIWIGIWRAIFDHKALALRAVATGCVFNAVWLFLWGRFLHIGLTPPRMSIEAIASLLIILLTQVATGWVVARTHRAYAVPMVVAFVIWLVLWNLAGALFSEAGRLLVNSFHSYLAWYLTPIFAEVAGLLFGGIVGAGPKEAASQNG
jgi:hypothetical protein